MALDPYSPCPGGEDKKVKFCCPDQMGDLEQISKMLEGQQFAGCLEHLGRLEKARPGRACVLATKCLLLRVTGKTEEANETATEFLRKYPNNQIALAESAIMTAAAGDGPKALKMALKAFVVAKGKIHPRTLDAWGATIQALLSSGMYTASRALAMMLTQIQRQDRQAMEMLMEINASDVPLVVKDDRAMSRCPEDASWKVAFDEASSLVDQVRWAEAAEQLESLAIGRAADSPIIWRNLSILRGWLADIPGAIAALEKLATLDVPFEDAVEAQAGAMFLKQDSFGDEFDLQDITFAIKNDELAQVSLISAPQVQMGSADLAQLADDEGVPPRAAFAIFEGPEPDGESPLTIATSPRLLAQALLFGKQTDRDARLEVLDVADWEADEVKRLLGEILGDALGEVVQTETEGQLSRSQDLLARRRRLPKDVTPERIEPFRAELAEDAVIKKWVEAPLGVLDGKSPREAAASDDLRVKALATVIVIGEWLRRAGLDFDLNRLRSELGLPTLDAIEVGDGTLGDVSLCRLSRVVVEKLDDDALLVGFQRSAATGATESLLRFAVEVADRTSIVETVHRRQAYEYLARLSSDPAQAIEYADKGRQASISAGESCASWDFLELLKRLEAQQPEEVMRLIQHLQTEHINEPGVAEALTRLLVQMGVIHPDGTPAAAPGGPAGPMPGGPGPEMGGEPDGGGLWTPDGQKPGEKSKLWTPDMG